MSDLLMRQGINLKDYPPSDVIQLQRDYRDAISQLKDLIIQRGELLIKLRQLENENEVLTLKLQQLEAPPADDDLPY